MSKQTLLEAGISLMQRFCSANGLEAPPVSVRSKASWPFRVCAYYRPTKIVICAEACADIGRAGRAWSYPGYTVDRTPYGVIQHELGHHVDVLLSPRFDRYRGEFSEGLRACTGEKPISGYCPDSGEWFAEIFRLFVTNPELLQHLRPAAYSALRNRFTPVLTDAWSVVLADAPARTLEVCAKKVAEATKPAQGTRSGSRPAHDES